MRALPSGGPLHFSPSLLRLSPDSRLVALIREGRPAAFEVVYDRHHRAILSFCRHVLGDLEEAQDVVQQTFLSAYNSLIESDTQIHLRAWLFTIARNRCYSVLRARREQPSGDLSEALTEGLAAQVQRRQDLRDLIVDMQHLPSDQRAALVLAELDALSHQQIGEVLGVPRDKVKALVFQARESLIASRAARETDCAEIREQLSTLRGGALRRGNLRRHLRECSSCREFRKQVERQRRQLAVLLPVAPSIALKKLVLGATVAGSAAAAGAVGGGSMLASSALKGGLVKFLVGAAVAGVGTAGTLVVANDMPLLNPAPHKPASHTLAAKAGSGTRIAAAGRTHASTRRTHRAARGAAGGGAHRGRLVSVRLGARHHAHHDRGGASQHFATAQAKRNHRGGAARGHRSHSFTGVFAGVRHTASPRGWHHYSGWHHVSGWHHAPHVWHHLGGWHGDGGRHGDHGWHGGHWHHAADSWARRGGRGR